MPALMPLDPTEIGVWSFGPYRTKEEDDIDIHKEKCDHHDKGRNAEFFSQLEARVIMYPSSIPQRADQSTSI